MRRYLSLALLTALGLAPLATAHAQTAGTATLATEAERSGFTRTGRYEEVTRLCQQFQAAYPRAVRCFSFGTTPEGRPMQALAVSTSGALTPQAAKARNLPVLLVQGGIHSGEIDGKDAGFLLLRELLEGKAAPGALNNQVLVFVPVFNVDGHENFRAWNRPNQRGPEAMGFRVTAQRYNLNRDYMKADSPEMRAMLGLANAWDPIVEMDLHVTDGAKFQHDISITAEPVNSGDVELRAAGRALKQGILTRLANQGSHPVGFYPTFNDEDDPASGFTDGVSTPRFSHGYYVLRNRMGILVETHSWRTYPERVRATRNAVLDLIELTARDGRDWLKVAHAADERATHLGGTPVDITYKATDATRTIDYLGYAYTRRSSAISGAQMTVYDETKPQTWKVPLRDVIVPALTLTAPRGGYLVPAAWASRVEPLLKTHGLRYTTLASGIDVRAEAFRAESTKFGSNSSEGHQTLQLKGSWAVEPQTLRAGSLFVPIAQPRARLVMGLLEPQAPDAIVAWGNMNTAFEQKEYMEGYVAEQEAERMLREDPALKAEFERRLRDDKAFADSPRARLDFFYRRHPAYDRDFNRYPVLRTEQVF